MEEGADAAAVGEELLHNDSGVMIQDLPLIRDTLSVAVHTHKHRHTHTLNKVK